MGMEVSNSYGNHSAEYSSATKAAIKGNETGKADAASAQEKAAGTNNTSNSTAAGMNYLMELEKKYSGTAFFVGTVSYGQTYGNSTDTNFVVNPAYLNKLGGSTDEQQKFEESIEFLHNASVNFRKQQEASGRRVINQGWFCDENGNWGGWCVTEATDKQSHLKEMNEKADKIREEKAEKKKAQKKLDEKRKAAKEEQDKIIDKYDENDISDGRHIKEQLEKQLKKHFGDDFKGYTVLDSDQIKNPDSRYDTESIVVDMKA